MTAMRLHDEHVPHDPHECGQDADGRSLQQRQKAQHKSNDKTDEIKGVHIIWLLRIPVESSWHVSEPFAVSQRPGAAGFAHRRPQNIEQPVEQRRRLDDCLKQQKAAPRIVVIRQRQQRPAQRRIAPEASPRRRSATDPACPRCCADPTSAPRGTPQDHPRGIRDEP